MGKDEGRGGRLLVRAAASGLRWPGAQQSDGVSMSFLSPKARIALKIFTPQRRRSDPRHELAAPDRDLTGKTIVFTGGTDGMGRVAVAALARMGAEIVVLGRDERKGEEVVREASAPGSARFELCDLASLESVRDCAGWLLQTCARIDALVNCAGVNAMSDVLTADGFHRNWAVNCLAPVLLTRLLADRLKGSAPARVVNLTTDTAYLDQVDFQAIETEAAFPAKDSYAASKLALEMFSVDLAEALAREGVTVNLLHPGYIRTNLLRNLKGAERVMQGVMRVMASPSEVGADRIVRLVASSEFEGVSGVLLAEDDRGEVHVDAQDDAKRARMARRVDEALRPWLAGAPDLNTHGTAH